MIPLRWHTGPKDWLFPIHLRSGSLVMGGLRVTPTGWEARQFLNADPTDRMYFATREEAEAWLIAVVRLSS